MVSNLPPNAFTYRLNYKEILGTQSGKSEKLAVPWHYLRIKLEEQVASELEILADDLSDLVSTVGDQGDMPVPVSPAENNKTTEPLTFWSSSTNNQKIVAKLKKWGSSLKKRTSKEKGNQ